MKYIIAILIAIIGLSSCTDYKELGQEAAKEAIKVVEMDNFKDIISGLEELNKKYEENFEDSDFEYGFKGYFEDNFEKTGYKKSITVDRMMEPVNGDADVWVEVGEYNIEIKNTEYLSPQFEINFQMTPPSRKKRFDFIVGDVKFLDENRRPIEEFSLNRNDDIETMLKSNSQNPVWVKVKMLDLIPSTFENNKLKEIKKAFQRIDKITDVNPLILTVNRRFDEETNNTSSTSYSSSDSEQEESTSDEDFDKWLDAYENYLDDYSDIMKKAKNGDMTAFTDMAEHAQKLQETGKKLDASKNDMTPSQIQRLIKLQAKVMQKMQEAQ